MFRFPYLRLAAVAAGVVLIAIAAIVPGDAYSATLTGGKKDLSWGPHLFRSLLVFHGLVLIAAGFIARPRSRESSTAELVPITGRSVAIMAGLTVAALALRLWNLNSAPWIDEVLTLVDFVRLPLGEIAVTFPSQNQHMLYSLLARTSFEIFGESVWALRLPAVLFGVGSIWAVFMFGRKILGERPALFAAALMTVSYHHIWFSQNARGYTGLLMATLLSTWAFLEALEENSSGWWAFYGAIVVLGMWIHGTMAFAVAAHFLVYALFAARSSSPERRAGLKPLVTWLLAVSATLQLYALSLPEFLATGLHEESRNSGWTSPIWVLNESIQNLSIGFAGLAVVGIGGAFVLFGWLSIFNSNKRAALLMVIPPLLSGGLMLALGHNLFPRFFFFAMGFGLLIVIHGAFELPRVLFRLVSILPDRSSFPARTGAALAAVIIIASILTVPRNYAMPKQDFAGAKEFVESRLSPDSKAIAVNLAGDIFSRYYAPDWRTTRDLGVIDELRRTNSSVWLVYTMPFEIEAFNPEIWKSINEDFTVVRKFPGTLNGGEVVVCRYLQQPEGINEPNRTISETTYLPDR